VLIELAWVDGDAENPVFEEYSDVVYLTPDETRWMDVEVRHYADRAEEYEHRVDAGTTDRPLARFEYAPRDAAVGDEIRLDASGSRAVERAVAAFDWTIHDRAAIGRTVGHELTAADQEGVPIALRVTDTQGQFDTVSRRIRPID
jgi:hypothetical protein